MCKSSGQGPRGNRFQNTKIENSPLDRGPSVLHGERDLTFVKKTALLGSAALVASRCQRSKVAGFKLKGERRMERQAAQDRGCKNRGHLRYCPFRFQFCLWSVLRPREICHPAIDLQCEKEDSIKQTCSYDTHSHRIEDDDNGS